MEEISLSSLVRDRLASERYMKIVGGTEDGVEGQYFCRVVLCSLSRDYIMFMNLFSFALKSIKLLLKKWNKEKIIFDPIHFQLPACNTHWTKWWLVYDERVTWALDIYKTFSIVSSQTSTLQTGWNPIGPIIDCLASHSSIMLRFYIALYVLHQTNYSKFIK